jgi:hypothetical protein
MDNFDRLKKVDGKMFVLQALKHTNQIHADRKMPAGHMGSQTHKSKNARHRYRTNLQTN